MKVRKTAIAPGVLLAVFVGCSAGTLVVEMTSPREAAAQVIDDGYFYEGLAPHGNWYFQAEFGWVWHPTRVAVNWRPYTEGQWVWADDVGWTWASAEPWGWATYHYGRWYFDPIYGWTWVPGYEWAPAWVSWRVHSGYIGWAPLWPIYFDHYPHHRWDHWDYDDDWGHRHRGRDWDRWVFCRDRDFNSDRISRVAVRDYRERDEIFRNSRDVTRWDRGADSIGHSIDRSRVERVARDPIQRVRLDSVDDPKRSGVRGDRMEVFRPRVEQRGDRTPDRLGIAKAPRDAGGADTIRQEKARLDRVPEKEKRAARVPRFQREPETAKGGAPEGIERERGRGAADATVGGPSDDRGRGAADRTREDRGRDAQVDRTREDRGRDAQVDRTREDRGRDQVDRTREDRGRDAQVDRTREARPDRGPQADRTREERGRAESVDRGRQGAAPDSRSRGQQGKEERLWPGGSETETRGQGRDASPRSREVETRGRDAKPSRDEVGRDAGRRDATPDRMPQTRDDARGRQVDRVGQPGRTPSSATPVTRSGREEQRREPATRMRSQPERVAPRAERSERPQPTQREAQSPRRPEREVTPRAQPRQSEQRMQRQEPRVQQRSAPARMQRPEPRVQQQPRMQQPQRIQRPEPRMQQRSEPRVQQQRSEPRVVQQRSAPQQQPATQHRGGQQDQRGNRR